MESTTELSSSAAPAPEGVWPDLFSDHSQEAREILRKASLSQNSELTVAEVARLQEAVEWYAEDPEVTGERLRNFILPPPSYHTGEDAGEGEIKMARSDSKSKRGGRPARPELSKATVTKLAKLRREGATWAEVDAEAGQHRSSTDWAKLFDEHGFDKLGRKGGKGKSEAQAWGSASNG